jgi:hypothetical protein
MIIQDLEQAIVVDREISPTPPKFKLMVHTGNVDGVRYITYCYGKNEQSAMKMADQAWEDYKKTHYGPGTTVETIRNRKEDSKIVVDKYKTQE